ncbi:MAG: protein kinase domain-containing protein [Isosphaeraceae bacterium]
MASIDTDRNLLFGVVALQGEMIDAGQLAEACTAWSVRKDRPLGDVLVERGWISADDRRLIEQLLERKLKKHSGDAHQSLITAASGGANIKATLDGIRERVDDAEIRQSLGDTERPRRAGDTIERLAMISQPAATRDRYTLTTLHAKGGIGQVWLARDTAMGREVALKELRPDRSDNDALLRRFFQEARITGQLDHPGVVPVYELAKGDASADGGRPYYTMRFVRGRTLSDAVADYHRERSTGEPGRSELLVLIQAFVGVCNTVAFAHSRNVIHRDLKGTNIVLGEFGEVILLDWGLAKLIDDDQKEQKPEADFDPNATAPYTGQVGWAEPDLTAAGAVLGTPSFMAPEQAEARADRIGRRTDVYGLGAILYEILAGKAPFSGDSTQDVLRKVREQPPTPPSKIVRSTPKALEAVCLKAMAKDPAGRYPSAAALAADVQHWLADEPVSAWREPWTIRTRRWVVRNRTAVAAGVAALGVAVVGLTAALAIQAQSNRALTAALASEKLARQDASAQSDQAEEAIESFFTGISQDVILRRPELSQLRGRLLSAALHFYEKRVKYLTDKHQGGGRMVRPITFGLDRIASLQAMLGDRDSAIGTRRRLIELYDTDSQLDPDRAAQAWLSLGELERLAGRPDDAIRSFREALKRFEQMSSELKVALVQVDLGRLLFDMGRADEGRRLLELARGTQEKFVAGGLRAMDLQDTYTTLANLHEAEGRSREALELYEKANAIYEKLARPRATVYLRAELARSLNNLGLARAKSGQLRAGLREVERGKEIREQLLSGQPLNIDPRADLARSWYHLARIQILSGSAAEAIASIKKAEDLYAGIPPKGPEDIYFRACMKALRAGLTGANKGETELSSSERSDRQHLADQAMALLKQAALAGYANPTRFRNDQPLESLRSRPDFQELLRSLAPPAK